MAEGFKTRRGGGTSKQPFGVLTANFPSGTVTVSNGSISMTATGTPALFTIPEAGTWTVKAVDGSHSKSTTISFTTQGQVENVELSYELVLFGSGKDNTAVTGGWSVYTGYDHNGIDSGTYIEDVGNYLEAFGTSPSVSAVQNKFGTAQAVDCKNYTQLVVNVAEVWSGGDDWTVTVGGASRKLSEGENLLDISKITSEQIIYLTVTATASSNAVYGTALIRISEMKLS